MYIKIYDIMKSNKIKNINNLQECVDYILDNRAGWSQFTSWYVEKYGANRKYANQVWKEAWEIISEDFSDNVKQSVNETLLKLEELEEEAKTEGDRRVWLEVLKYRNKIRGGEIERQEIKVQGEVRLSWGNELSPDFGNTEIL
jgi:hypothetical protein